MHRFKSLFLLGLYRGNDTTTTRLKMKSRETETVGKYATWIRTCGEKETKNKNKINTVNTGRDRGKCPAVGPIQS